MTKKELEERVCHLEARIQVMRSEYKELLQERYDARALFISIGVTLTLLLILALFI